MPRVWNSGALMLTGKACRSTSGQSPYGSITRRFFSNHSVAATAGYIEEDVLLLQEEIQKDFRKEMVTKGFISEKTPLPE